MEQVRNAWDVSRKGDLLFWGIAVLGCALFASIPLLTGNLIVGHDVWFHLMRIEGLKDGLEGGQFPVRIYGYFFSGYGYPSGFFYPDLFLYLPALLRLAGCSVVFSFHAFYVVLNIVTAMLAWWSFSRLFSNSLSMGALAAMVYTGFLYRLADMYSRCAVGEALAMAFFPVALVSFWKLLREPSESDWVGVVLGCTGVLQSHIISSLLLAGAMAGMLLVSCGSLAQREKLAAVGKAALFTVLLNLWFYAPFYSFYRQYDFSIKQVLTGVETLKNAAWSWDAMATLQGLCGILPLVLCGAFLIFCLTIRREHSLNLESRLFFPMLSIGVLSLFLMTSLVPWDILGEIPLFGKKLGVLQFGFRFMVYGSLAFSLCCAIAMAGLFHETSHFHGIAVICCFVMIGANLLLLSQKELLRVSNANGLTVSWAIWHEDALLEDGMRISDLKPMESGLVDTWNRDYLYKDIPEQAYLKEGVSGGSGAEVFLRLSRRELQLLQPDDISPRELITEFSRKGTELTFSCQSSRSEVITLPLFYYPGYEAVSEDGEVELELSSREDHRMQITVPAGYHKITIRYTGRAAWNHAGWISFAGWGLFLCCIGYGKYRRRLTG